MADVRLKISPPWITYINKIVTLFDGDPQIACNLDTQVPSITLSTNNPEKAVAIRRLLPTTVNFGNVDLEIEIDCGKPLPNIAFKTNKELFEAAFTGNPAFAECISPVDDGYWYADFTYVIFKNCVVQFFNDNLNDARGLISTLYQDIAAELFADAPSIRGGVGYCTDVERGALGKPLGEWP